MTFKYRLISWIPVGHSVCRIVLWSGSSPAAAATSQTRVSSRQMCDHCSRVLSWQSLTTSCTVY